VVWKTIGPNAAVLLGDLLYCEALSEILKGENARQCSRLVDKVKEVCAAEMDQELHLRSNALSQPQCVAIARRKTGPLFAFLGFVCGGNDAPLSEALEEAGYLTGAAYQLADDMLDAVGSEEVAGKTLHTDELRQKYTVAREAGDNGVEAAGLVWNMLKSALALLSPWPLYQKGLSDFLVQDLQPVLDSYLIPIDIKAQLAA
jgi:geranylgeranyl pyrophosphate synthase